MKRVLYITYDGLTDPLGQSQVLPYLMGLADKGFEIHVLSFEKQSAFEKQKNVIEELVNKSGINWHYRSFTQRPKYLAKMYDLNKMRSTAIALHQKFTFDAVHCRSYISVQAGLTLKKRFGVKLIFDMRGFWVDERIDSGQWNDKNPLYRILIKRYRKIEKEALAISDHIVSLTQKAKDHMVDQWSVKEEKINVIPCCVDMDLFNRDKIDTNRLSQLRKELGVRTNDHIIIYSGSLGGLYLTNQLLLFYKQIKAIQPGAKLLILSHISKELLSEYLNNENIEQADVILRWSNRIDMPYYLALCNVAVCFIKPSFSKIASCPTKLPEYLSMGLPVVVNAGIGDDDQIIRQYSCGIVLSSFDDEEIKRNAPAVVALATPLSQSVACAQDYYSLKTGVEKYFSIYNNI